MEVYSPGGMMDGSLIQHLDPMNVPSKRRNPLLADFFNRLELMERRGSGMKKIVKEYKHFEKFPGYKAPEFKSNSGEFHVTLWNLNYDEKQFANDSKEFANSEKQFANEKKETAKEVKQRKEFVKAKRAIYKLITSNPKVTTAQIADKLNVSTRQVQKYLKRLTEQNLIVKEGSRINGYGFLWANIRIGQLKSDLSDVASLFHLQKDNKERLTMQNIENTEEK